MQPSFQTSQDGTALPRWLCAGVFVCLMTTPAAPHKGLLFIVVHKDVGHLGSPPGGAEFVYSPDRSSA